MGAVLVRSVYLVVVDGSAEMNLALRYACCKALAIGGSVAYISFIPRPGFSYFTRVQKELESGYERELTIELDALDVVVKKLGLHEQPRRYQAQSQTFNGLVDVMGAIEDLRGLVLASSDDSGSANAPGPLIAKLLSGGLARLSVPIHIIPGHLSDDDLDALMDRDQAHRSESIGEADSVDSAR